MNRRTLILLLTLAVIIIVAIVGYTVTRPHPGTDNNVSQPSQGSQPTTSAGDGSSEPKTGAGVYVDYSPTAIADAAGTSILFFHAPWCPSCRQIDSEITSNGVPDDVTIIKVDYDTHQDLRQKYGVTVQTTFVKVDETGKELDKFVPSGGNISLDPVLDALT